MKIQQLIYILAGIKLLIHFLSNSLYGLHRDEFLYLAEGKHLGWGYMEGPPVIALLAWLTNLMGNSVFTVRLLPALTGAAGVILVGLLVKELGGKKWAIFIACLAVIVSPVYLRVNTLFQPVSFNQFLWLANIYVVILLIRTQNPKYWIALGLAMGLGLMTKYSIIFLLTAFFLAGFFYREHRKWYSTRYPYIALGIALIIFLPNLLWQMEHNWPVVTHMNNLRAGQLVNVKPLTYLTDQLLYHMAASLIWVSGLIYLFTSQSMRPFRIVGLAYFLMIALLMLLSAKSYYTMGIYPILFVFGGIAWENWLSSNVVKSLLVGFIILFNSLILPYSLPVLSIENMERFCLYMSENFGLDSPITWENGRRYTVPQDYADMRGWEDMVYRVSRFYHSLPEDQKETCQLWGGSYGHAGAINFYRQKYNLPEALSVSASFVIWCPKENNFESMLILDDTWLGESQNFQKTTFIDSSEVTLSRDPGYIFYRSEPKVHVPDAWRDAIGEAKKPYNF